MPGIIYRIVKSNNYSVYVMLNLKIMISFSFIQGVLKLLYFSLIIREI